MIHICTVHWRNATWIDLQQSFLQENFSGSEYRLYVSYSGIPSHFFSDCYFSIEEDIRDHATKLNRLADYVSRDPSSLSSDILIFIDGDAFPIAPIASSLAEHLKRAPLIAVRRDENHGDRQPHPSFCATTLGFWTALPGDWRSGPTWLNKAGKPVTDVGALLLERLQEKGNEWTPMLKSNPPKLHPVFFSVYERLVYHHGAGFRRKVSRADLVGQEPTATSRALIGAENEELSNMVISSLKKSKSDFLQLIGAN